MATRLLSFLNDIEQALLKESGAHGGLSWAITRMVNYHHGLARMTLTPPDGSDPTQMRGSIFVQSFELADGSLCAKASLNWQGSDSFPVIAVYAKPDVDWPAEALRIASTWLAGPLAPSVTNGTRGLAPLVAHAS